MQILEELQNSLIDQKKTIYSEGRVTKYFDGFLQVRGLNNVFYHEVIYIHQESYGTILVVKALVVEVSDISVKALLLDNINISAGAKAISKGDALSITIDINKRGIIYDSIASNITELLKNEDPQAIIDSVVIPIDLSLKNYQIIKDGIEGEGYNPSQDLKTGILAIDALSPIVKNRTNLIKGQKNTGKTTIAFDTILNQKGKDIVCIYCGIAKTRQDIYILVNNLKQNKIVDNIIIINSYCDNRAINQYLAPFVAYSIAKKILEKGGEVIVIYDDFSKHLQSYKHLCYLLNAPIDISGTYSKLLDKTDLTTLAILEGVDCDGDDELSKVFCRFTSTQIYLDSCGYRNGLRPAINTSLSSSYCYSSYLGNGNPIGQNSIQTKKDLSLYKELYQYQNATELNYDHKKSLKHLVVLRRMMIQPNHHLLNPACIVARLRLGNTNYLDKKTTKEIDETFLDLDKSIITIWGQEIEDLNNGQWNQKIEDKIDSIIKKLLNIF